MRRLGLLACLLALVFPSSALGSAWDRPALVSPVTVHLSEQNRNLKLSQFQDYILDCPTNPMPVTWSIVVWGGHNVVLENCAVQNNGTVDASGNPLYSGGAQFKDQTGTLWVHDVHFAGAHLNEGIDLQEPGTTAVVLRDVLIDQLYGSYTTNHADCIQTWSGPQRLFVDGFTCSSGYQGFFLLPNQWDSTTVPTDWEFRNIDLVDNATSFWLGDLYTEPMIPTWDVQNVYANPLSAWDGTSSYGPHGNGPAWVNARSGATPSGGHYVWATAGGAYGIDDPSAP